MKFIIAIILISFSLSSYGSDYKKEIDKFFKLYEKGKTVEAVDSIYSTNKFVSSIPDQVAKVKSQLVSVGDLVGNLHQISEIDTYTVGDAFVHVTYLATYDRQPIRFEFQFFKVKEGWRIYSFSFDDDMDEEVKLLARKHALGAK